MPSANFPAGLGEQMLPLQFFNLATATSVAIVLAAAVTATTAAVIATENTA